MAQTHITLGGGAGKTGTAAPGRFNNDCCDSCGAEDDLMEWESQDGPGAKVYRYCSDCLGKTCTGCGVKATTEFEARDGTLHPVCDHCDVHLREQDAEMGDGEWEILVVDDICADCKKEPATRRFLHLHKGEFFLCDGCWQMADHEDDYLEVCTCSNPLPAVGAAATLQCMDCLRTIKHRSFCECPVVDKADEDKGSCSFCYGLIVKLKDD